MNPAMFYFMLRMTDPKKDKKKQDIPHRSIKWSIGDGIRLALIVVLVIIAAWMVDSM